MSTLNLYEKVSFSFAKLKDNGPNVCSEKLVLEKMSANIWAPKSVVEELRIQPPLSRVELHVHLDGSIRRETLFELLKVKNLKCPGDGSFQAFRKAIEVTKPKDLQRFLSAFPIFMPGVKYVYESHFECLDY